MSVNKYGHTILESTEDLNWKNGYVQCECGWRKELGDGFNGYRISSCPKCDPRVETRTQHTVTTGKPGNYTIKHGSFIYFVIHDCIHVQYSGVVYQTQYRQRIRR